MTSQEQEQKLKGGFEVDLLSTNKALRTGLFVQKQNNNQEVICLGDQELFLLRSDRASKPSSEVLFTLWVV